MQERSGSVAAEPDFAWPARPDGPGTLRPLWGQPKVTVPLSSMKQCVQRMW